MNSTGYAKPVISVNPSVQGLWHEKLDIHQLDFKVITR